MHTRAASIACLLFLGLSLFGCAEGTDPAGTRGLEERYLGMGEAQQLYRYAQDLLADGRYTEAHAAFFAAERKAYTDDLRQAARVRRLWLEQAIAAHRDGQTPPPPPVVSLAPPSVGQGELKPVLPQEPPPPPASEPPLDPDGRPLLPSLNQPR